MAIWKADVFVNSTVGRITTEVEAATFQGAKQQIYAKHGDVQQIVNLREVNSSSSFGSSGGDAGGTALLLGILFLIWLVVSYWYFVVPGAIFLGILYYYAQKNGY